MTLQDRLVKDVGLILARTSGPAQDMTYIRKSDSAETAFRGVIERLRIGEEMFANGEHKLESAVIHVPVGTITAVTDGDTIVVPSAADEEVDETWAVSGVRHETAALREVEVVRSTRTKLTDETHARDVARRASFVRSV